MNTPELLGMDLFPAARPLRSSTYTTPRCYGMVMPDILYYPAQGVILDGKRRAIEDEYQVPIRTHWYDWKPFVSRDAKIVSGSSFVFRSFGQNIYHLLTDHLPALFMLGELSWESKEPIKLLLPRPLSEAARFLVPKLCPEHVEIVEVESKQLYRLERCVYVSQLAQRGCGYLPYYYLRHFLERVTPKRPRRGHQRIYISRAMSTSRRILNEEELVSGLRRQGFTSYCLETLPIADQIELFYDAEIVVAAHGAGLVNLLYAENAKVLELFPGPLVRPHFYFLCKARQHQYRYLVARKDISFPARLFCNFEESFNGSTRDFRVNCEEILRTTEDFLGQGKN